MKLKLFFVITVFIAIQSCDRPRCTNTNAVFDKNELNSKQYNDELVREIKKYKTQDITYWFKQYINENNKEYILVNIQNDSLCAVGKFKVVSWDKLEGVKQTKGVGYIGAQLKGFNFVVEKDSLKTELVYKNIDKILD